MIICQLCSFVMSSQHVLTKFVLEALKIIGISFYIDCTTNLQLLFWTKLSFLFIDSKRFLQQMMTLMNLRNLLLSFNKWCMYYVLEIDANFSRSFWWAVMWSQVKLWSASRPRKKDQSLFFTISEVILKWMCTESSLVMDTMYQPKFKFQILY